MKNRFPYRTFILRLFGCVLVGAVLCCTQSISHAQEALETILERGYVAHWLVCGPFEPDVPGGIVAAIQRGEAPLGNKDFMAPIGGIARLRPKHKEVVTQEGEDALWQRAGRTDASLDLFPFFPEKQEGISYAAFYTEVAAPQAVLFDLQSSLGARIWINGFPFRDIKPTPVAAAGVDRFVVNFKAGANLLIFEIPGAAYSALAKAANMTLRELGARGFINRPLLQGMSGFEIALTLKPVLPLDDLYYVPKLSFANTFSGTANDVRQDMEVTLFNPTNEFIEGIEIETRAPALVEPMVQKTPSLRAQSMWQERIAVPMGDAEAGSRIPVTVDLTAQTETVSFTTDVRVEPRAREGKVYVVTGQRFTPESPESQSLETEAQIQSMLKQLFLAEREPDYGFDLGEMHQWHPLYVKRPDLRPLLKKTVAMAKTATRAGFSHPDERLVSGETLVRNLLMGIVGGRDVLSDLRPSYPLWNSPGMAPQTPQILRDSGLSGLVSNLEIAGIPELSQQQALDGTPVWHRRKQSPPQPTTEVELREMTTLQRRELLARDLPFDVLFSESQTRPPEPFYFGAAQPLANSYPAILLDGGGAYSFFTDLEQEPEAVLSPIPHSGRLLSRHMPGSILSQPALKYVHALLENRIRDTELWATFAALLGANYPNAAVDYTWRQLLYWSTPERLALAEKATTYLDAFAGCRDAAQLTVEVQKRSTSYIADEINTLDTAPLPMEKVTALVVFNPTSWERTDWLETELDLEPVVGLSVRDETGKEIPFVIDRIKRINVSLLRGFRLRFVAEKIPPMGYRTYYLSPTGTLPKIEEDKGLTLENSYYTVTLNPETGDIAGIIDRRTGRSLSTRPWNQLLALPQKKDALDDGRELWTDGEAIRTQAVTAIKRCRSTSMQSLEVTTPFLSGTATRTLCLYEGVPRLDCAVRLENLDWDTHVVNVAFPLDAEGQTPIYGERFGATVGRRSKGRFDFKTRGMDNISGAGLQPALRWVATSLNDHFRVGESGIIPLRPTCIIHGREPILRKAGRDLMTALLRRGIPAVINADRPRKLDFLWTDSTEFPTLDEDIAHNTAMRIVLGGPGQNAFCDQIMERLPKEEQQAFSKQLNQGALLLWEDSHTLPGFAPVPTLLVAGLTPEHTEKLVKSIITPLEATGIIPIAEDRVAMPHTETPSKTGLALLFSGTHLCSLENDDTLLLGLAHDVTPYGQDKLRLKNTPLHFHYALYPFEESWRKAQLPLQAYAYSHPLTTATTDLHIGRLQPTQSFIEIDHPEFILTTVKPAGYQYSVMSAQPNHARDGIILRGFESCGEPWRGQLNFFRPLNAVRYMNTLEESDYALSVDESTFIHQAPGFSIDTLRLLPSTRFRQAIAKDLSRSTNPYGPIATRYWRNNPGAAPMKNLPVSLFLEGDPTDYQGMIEVVISNNLIDATVEGGVLLEGATGWNLGKTELYYKLEAGEMMAEKIPVSRTTEDNLTGGIVAWTTFEEQVYRDTFCKHPEPFLLEARRNEAQIKVTVQNQTGIPAAGYVDLITSPDYWPELGMHPEITVLPHRAAVSIPPFQKQEILFRFSDPDPQSNIVVKLSANNHISYELVP